MLQRLPITSSHGLMSFRKTTNGANGGLSFAPSRRTTAKNRRSVSAAAVTVIVAASSSRGFGAKTQQPSPSAAAKNEPPIPSSREEAISQAATALATSLTTKNSSSSNSSSAPSSSLDVEELESLSSSRGKKTLAKAKKTKKASSSSSPQGFGRAAARVTLEVPIADESPEATAALAVDLIKALSSSSPPSPAHLAFGDVDAALVASDLLGPDSSTSVSALDADEDDEEGEASSSSPSPRLLLVVAPTPQQAPRVASLLSPSSLRKNFRSTDAALLNAKWEASAPPEGLSGFSTAYAFVPLAVQGFLGATTTSGAMLCARVPGGTSQPLWRIYKDEDGRGSFAVVGRSQRRPGPRDIEDAFYNSAAASSPVTKGVAAITGLFNKNK